MGIDWSESDFAFLRDKLRRGEVVLFAGAGFSVGARNAFKSGLPLGGGLAELLAQKAKLPYKGEPLPTVYEAVVPILGSNALWRYLSDLYKVTEYDDWYHIVSAITWCRIYTINIDDLFQRLAPLRSGQQLRTIVRLDPPQERDQLSDRLQCIHLHGHIDHRRNELTFTVPDFAQHTAKLDPWYHELVDDIHNYPVVIVGTMLEEPMLQHYLALREQKVKDTQGRRPKSFLVDPSIGPIHKAMLQSRNIRPIRCTGKEFFESLATEEDIAEFRVKAVQSRVYPHMFQPDKALAREVAGHFDLILPNLLPAHRDVIPTRFFLGAEPRWTDIKNVCDGDREITRSLLEKLLENDSGFRCIVLHGPAGCGKTTTMMRLAHCVAEAGKQVFFARGAERLDMRGVLELAKNRAAEEGRLYVFVDVVTRQLPTIAGTTEQLKASDALTLVLADRTNKYARRSHSLDDLEPEVVKMPDLSRSDVESILSRLEQFGYLGVLRDLPHAQRVEAFMIRASRQLLVAMREATSGRDFDLILQDEYQELTPAAQLAYTIASLAVMHGAQGVYTKHLTPCLPKSELPKGVIICDLLRGILVPANQTGTMLMPRHRLIGEWIAKEIAPVEKRYEALSVFLKQIASYIVPNEIRRRSPAYIAYRGMINSAGLKETLEGHSSDILGLYEELVPYYSNDFLFWLQYGMAYSDAGDLDAAENFLNQSLALRPNSHQTLHHMGVLYLKQASQLDNVVAAEQRAKEGMDLLMEQIRVRGDEDSHPYHAYLTHVCRWYEHAGSHVSQKEWEKLRAVAREARKKYQLDDMVIEAANEVDLAYMRRAVVAKSADE